jgi:hypothetical protein
VAGRPTDELALIFYVARKGEGPEAIPTTIELTPEGQDRPLALPTDVVETPPVQPEG